jgi:transcriptional regulator with XRE-family HTH domain
MSLERGRYYAILGALVVRERKRKKLTQAALAEKIDVSQSFVARIEAGKLSVDTYLFGQTAKNLFECNHAELDRRIHEINGQYFAAEAAVSPKRIPSRDAERALIDYVVAVFQLC